ncbi:MAG: carboxylating nicotinate-nucleotide diphosphorylase [Blastocatellia bacterium]|nr:carboxylating nicotinate-nucleotide diphosphorylase [Blastocatellia bacterium]
MRLDLNIIQNLVATYLEEDIGRGDVTTQTTVAPDIYARGKFLAKSGIVLAGLEVAELVFQWLDPELQLEAFYFDGDTIAAGTEIARIEGPAHVLLAGERVALNLLQRMSGIATLTRRYVKAVEGTGAQIVDTRKTAPGLRIFDKYAVKMGGGRNHRFGLDDGLLIKDNHIALAGGLAIAVKRARETGSHLLKIEVEAATLEQVKDAVKVGADVVLLDNMTPEKVREAVTLIRAEEPAGRRTLTEASGSVSLETVRGYAEAGVDLISVGALTHSPAAADISLKMTAA